MCALCVWYVCKLPIFLNKKKEKEFAILSPKPEKKIHMPTPNLLQQLRQHAKSRPAAALRAGAEPPPVMVPAPVGDAMPMSNKTSSSNAIRYGLIIAFVVVLVIGVVLVVNRLHEQSHNANIVERDDSEWKDLDVTPTQLHRAQGDSEEDRNTDPNFTMLSDLV